MRPIYTRSRGNVFPPRLGCYSRDVGLRKRKYIFFLFCDFFFWRSCSLNLFGRIGVGRVGPGGVDVLIMVVFRF